MHLEEIQFNPKFSLLSGQKEILKNIIEWKDTPPVVKTGRSTFLVIDNNNVPFTGIKIKGCGYFDIIKNHSTPPSDKDEFDIHIINGSNGIKEIHYVTKVNDKNELDFMLPEKRPFGGQVFTRAKLEYDANKTLFDNWKDSVENFPFYFPVGYAKYGDLKLNKNNLGVTILGTVAPVEVPLSNYFEGTFEEKGLKINPYIIRYWQKHCAPLGKLDPDYFDLLSALKKLCFEFGRSMRFLHEHYVDFDAHFFNATVNTETGGVILFDFDHVSGVKDMTAQKYFYFSLKDFESGIVAVLSNFLLSGLSHGVILFEELSQPYEDYNPVKAYFEGYFGNLSDKSNTEAKEIWERIIMLIMNKVINNNPDKVIHIVYDFCEFERKKSYIDMLDQMKEKINKKYRPLILEKDKHKEIIENFYKKLEIFLNSHK